MFCLMMGLLHDMYSAVGLDYGGPRIIGPRVQWAENTVIQNSIH